MYAFYWVESRDKSFWHFGSVILVTRVVSRSLALSWTSRLTTVARHWPLLWKQTTERWSRRCWRPVCRTTTATRKSSCTKWPRDTAASTKVASPSLLQYFTELHSTVVLVSSESWRKGINAFPSGRWRKRRASWWFSVIEMSILSFIQHVETSGWVSGQASGLKNPATWCCRV